MEFKNPFKLTPGTIENDKYNTRPLMTNENSPKVKKVIGNEKNCMTGLTTTLRQPNIIVNIIKEARELIENTGYQEVSLSSLSTCDYSDIKGLIKDLMNEHSANKVSVALPSIRVDAFSVDLIKEIQKVKRTGFI